VQTREPELDVKAITQIKRNGAIEHSFQTSMLVGHAGNLLTFHRHRRHRRHRRHLCHRCHRCQHDFDLLPVYPIRVAFLPCSAEGENEMPITDYPRDPL